MISASSIKWLSCFVACFIWFDGFDSLMCETNGRCENYWGLEQWDCIFNRFVLFFDKFSIPCAYFIFRLRHSTSESMLQLFSEPESSQLCP